MKKDCAVCIECLGKRYGDKWAVENISLDVFAGDVFALLGPNGTGKTTTIRMLTGTLKPDRGTARIKGYDCFKQRSRIMRDVGYVPDDPFFYDYLTGRQIVHFAGEVRQIPSQQIKLRLERLAARFRIKEDLDSFAVNYSKGMKKKLALILSLIHDPKVLILDEPGTGLDPYSLYTMQKMMLKKASQGKTILLSTHLIDQAEKLCTRAGILYNGRIPVQGSLKKLKTDFPLAESLEDVFFASTRENKTF